MGAIDEIGAVEPEADTALIRRDAHEESRPVEQANRVDRPGKPADVLDAAQITDVVNQRAIAVQKHRGSCAHWAPPDGRRRDTASKTRSTVMRFMQRWSMGQSPNRQGRQNTGSGM